MAHDRGAPAVSHIPPLHSGLGQGELHRWQNATGDYLPKPQGRRIRLAAPRAEHGAEKQFTAPKDFSASVQEVAERNRMQSDGLIGPRAGAVADPEVWAY